MLPKITELEFDTTELPEDLPPIGKSFLFDFDKNDFVLVDGKTVELHGLESLKMWIVKAIKTERFQFKIYKDIPYGVLIEDLIGSNFPRAFIEAEIQREVTSALLGHPHILGIENWTFTRDGKRMVIYFRVRTAEETFEQEMVF